MLDILYYDGIIMSMNEIEIYSYLSYLGPFWLVGLLSERRRNKHLRFHINQGLMLFILEIVLITAYMLLRPALKSIPYAGEYVAVAVALLMLALVFVLSVRGMLGVSKGLERRLPIIGFIHLLDSGARRTVKPYTAKNSDNRRYRK